jgi:hypothetical protein
MIIVLKKEATEEQVGHIVQSIHGWGLRTHISRGIERTVVGVIGDEALIATKPLDAFPGVDSVVQVQKPYKLASREFKKANTRSPSRPRGRATNRWCSAVPRWWWWRGRVRLKRRRSCWKLRAT